MNLIKSCSRNQFALFHAIDLPLATCHTSNWCCIVGCCSRMYFFIWTCRSVTNLFGLHPRDWRNASARFRPSSSICTYNCWPRCSEKKLLKRNNYSYTFWKLHFLGLSLQDWSASTTGAAHQPLTIQAQNLLSIITHQVTTVPMAILLCTVTPAWMTSTHSSSLISNTDPLSKICYL